MKKFGFNGEAERQLHQERIETIHNMVDMFQAELDTANELELNALAVILKEAAANYVKAVQQIAKNN